MRFFFRAERNEIQKALLLKVKQSWIDNVLASILNDIPNLHQKITFEDNTTQEDIYTAYRNGRDILILGDPGVGKTVCLLTLCDRLIQDAEKDERLQIPIVFTLSSWSYRHKNFKDWVLDELRVHYQILGKTGQTLIDNNRISYLLDGLDEVAPENQQKCLDAIQNFLDTSVLNLQIVITSRRQDYQQLRTKLSGRHLISAVIQPMSHNEIEEYFKQHPNLDKLHQHINADTKLKEISQNPFLLSIMIRTLPYLQNIQKLQAKQTRSEAESFLLNQYIETRFYSLTPFSYVNTRKWLTFLAQCMKQNSQTIFVVGRMQIQMLDSQSKKVYFFITRGLFILLISGVVTLGGFFMTQAGVEFPTPANRFPVIGLAIGSIACLFNERFIPNLIKAILIGLCTIPLLLIFFDYNIYVEPTERIVLTLTLSAFSGLGAWLNFRYSLGGMNQDERDIHPVEVIGWIPKKIVFGLLLSTFIALIIFGAVVVFTDFTPTVLWILPFTLIPAGITGGLIGGWDYVGNITSPWWIISQSFRNSLIVFVTLTTFSVLLGTAAGLFIGVKLRDALLFSAVCGICLGSINSLFFGGIDTIKHYTLRLLLGCTRRLPFRLIQFLDFAVSKGFLRKFSGNYMFIHRTLRDHLATTGK